MGRLVRFSRSRSPLPEFERAIATLNEELALSLNYARAMVRGENYLAAVEVIEEQRRSLSRASTVIERIVCRPRRHRLRTRSVLAGLAAAVLIGSGAFAAWGPRDPAEAGGIEAVRDATEALRAASRTDDPQELRALVGSVHRSLLALAPKAATDPEAREALDDIQKLREEFFSSHPNVPADLLELTRLVTRRVQAVLQSPPSPAPLPKGPLPPPPPPPSP